MGVRIPPRALRLKFGSLPPDEQEEKMGGHSRVLVDPVDPTPNRRHIARSLGLLFLIEGTLGEAWLLLPHDAEHSRTGAVVLICALAQALGVWMRRGAFDEAPVWVLKATVTIGTLLA